MIEFKHTGPRQFECYVKVVGQVSEDEDSDVPGFYLIVLSMRRELSIESLTAGEKSEMATAVLDEFHRRTAIGVLEDFEISAYFEDGSDLIELPVSNSTRVVSKAEFFGHVCIANDYFGEVKASELPPALAEAIRTFL